MLPVSLGIKTFGDVNTTLIPAGTTLPSIKSEVFSTADDNQASVEIHVLQGENEKAGENESVVKAVLSGIPLHPRGVPQIEVKFELDANSFLTVSARELVTGKEIQVRAE